MKIISTLNTKYRDKKDEKNIKKSYEKHTYNNNKSTATFKQEMIITITAKLR